MAACYAAGRKSARPHTQPRPAIALQYAGHYCRLSETCHDTPVQIIVGLMHNRIRHDPTGDEVNGPLRTEVSRIALCSAGAFFCTLRGRGCSIVNTPYYSSQ